ncbi:MAG: 6-carboxytetrahydropterin synthase, partial [Planctomycetota bacterium]
SFMPHELVSVKLALSPHTRLATDRSQFEQQMIALTHTFEFAASHRLHSDRLSDDENRALFGKCNNVHGHGHNYVVEVTVAGTPDDHGVLLPIDTLEQIVDERVISPMDHRHLNVEVDEFAGDKLNPSVENIAKVCYDRLHDAIGEAGASLDAVRVWETPKTWCEYRRDG